MVLLGAVFGGCGADNKTLNDVHRLSLTAMEWQPVSCGSGPVPVPRAGHSALGFGSSLVVCGGFVRTSERLDKKKSIAPEHVVQFSAYTNQWTKLDVSTQVPPGRCFAADVLVDDHM